MTSPPIPVPVLATSTSIPPSPSPSPHPVLLFLSGSLAGCWAETVTQPLDCTKIRMQLQEDERRLGKTVNHQQPASTTQYRGTFRTALTMIREEGFLSLYSGLPPAFARQTIKAGMQMSMYRWIRDVVASATSTDPRQLSLWQKVVSASLSGVIGQAIANPADVVKVRLQADGRRRYQGLPPRYHGTIDAIVKIYHQAGIRGFWTGCIPSLQRSALTAGGGLASYDHIKQWILKNTNVHDQTRVHIAVSAISSGISTLLACPPDVLKTRMMNQSLSNPIYHGTWDCLVKIVRQEGTLALYKGFIPTYVRIAPWQMCFFTSYEFISHLLTGTRL